MAHTDVSLEKIPPQNLEAERSVLGALLIENEAIFKVVDTLRTNHFYKESHRKIFNAILALSKRREPLDLVILTDELLRRKELDEVGGASYLSSLVESVPTAANVEYYAKIVREKALLRELISIATEITARGYADQDEAETLVDEAEKKIFEIAQDRITRGFIPISQILRGSFEIIEKLYQKKDHITGVPTGFTKLDQMTAGLQPADLVIIAGRPSMGKTSLCLNIAAHAAIEAKIPVAVFSLEMASEQLVMRLLCSEARVDAHRLRTGYLGEKDWKPLTNAAGRLTEAPIFIDDSAAISPLELRAKARRLMAEQGLGLLIVDYLQLMRSHGRAENRQQEISEITRSLKALAKELSVPVVALSQLSRAVETRSQEKRPQLSDLRESGAIEQDADVVIFIYRPEMYSDLEEKKGVAEIIIGKQRNGPTGTVMLTFLRQYTRFEDAELHRQPVAV
jgi:replicative DNA helicase